jgi:hypothetical protein
MPEQSSAVTTPLQLCLDDELLCRRGPIAVTITSISGSGLAVLMFKNQPPMLDPSRLMSQGGEGRPLRLTARIGGRSIALTAQLVWAEPVSGASDDVELIIDATGVSDWPAIVAAHRGAA